MRRFAQLVQVLSYIITSLFVIINANIYFLSLLILVCIYRMNSAMTCCKILYLFTVKIEFKNFNICLAHFHNATAT